MNKKDILALAKEAKTAIAATETTLSNRIRVLATYAFGSDFAGASNGLQAVRKWAKSCGFTNKKDFNPEMVLKGWKIVDGLKNEVKLTKTPIYKIDPKTKAFIYEETTNKRGQKQYKKIVEFYVFEPKKMWSLNDVIDSICNYQLTIEPTGYAQEIPYVVVNGKLEVSDKADFRHRALYATREEEEIARAIDAEIE